MWRYLVCPLVLMVLIMPVKAGEEDAKDDEESPASPAEQYEALQKEFNQALQKFSAEYRKVTTQEERQKLFDELYPRPEKFAPRFMEIARQHPDDPAALDALVWVVVHAGNREHGEQAIDLLANQHIQSPKLVPVCQRLMYNRSPAAQRLLESARENSPHRDVQGWATYALAKGMMRSGAGAGNSEQRAEAEKLLERVAAEFADIESYRGTLANLAKGDLFELRHLAIGCVAPDIEGQDIDGVAFKLSDYRGKVVVLDFWGHW